MPSGKAPCVAPASLYAACGVAFLCRSARWHEVGAQQASALGTGRAGLQASVQEVEKGSHPSATLPFPTRGEVRGGGGRQRSWGGCRSRIALQCALNKGVHLDLIGSNALFSDPICLSRAKFGEQLCPIVSPSFCKSIPVRALIIADVSGGIRAVGDRQP